MNTAKRVLRVVLGVLMILAGAAHFAMPDSYAQLVPAALPFPLEIVYVTGVLEILGGVGLFIPRTRIAAAWSLFAFLIAVTPANVNQMLNNIQPEGLEMSESMLRVRLLIQLVFIAWAYWLTRRDE